MSEGVQSKVEIVEEITYVEVVEEITNIVEVAIQGPPGPGMPIGGKTGEFLVKASNLNYDFIWKPDPELAIQERYDSNNDGKVDLAEFADEAANALTFNGRSITDFYDKEEVDTITARYIHTQTLPSKLWTVNHNLNRYPSVVVVDSANSTFDAVPRYISLNTLELEFNIALSGRAFCN